jgi:hypothetical protein
LGPAQGVAAVRTDAPRLAALLPSPPLEFSRKRALERSYDTCWVHSMLPASVHCTRRRGCWWLRCAATAAQTSEPASAPNIFVIQASVPGPRSADLRRPAGRAAEQFEQARAHVHTRAKKTLKRSNASAKLSESRAGCCAGYCIAEVRAPPARQGGLSRGERRGRCAHGKPAFQTLPLPLPRPLRLCVVLGSALAGLWARKDRAEGELGGVLRRACSFKLLLARPRYPRTPRTPTPVSLSP